MPKSNKADIASAEIWKSDQLRKSQLFHRKLHDWKLLEISDQINEVQGENLNWSDLDLGITSDAWNKVIHRGVKPVIVFAHPTVLQAIVGSVAYYRMLAMVSQKSMANIGLDVKKYEIGRVLQDSITALNIAHRLNSIVSTLIEDDEEINIREFDLWRGMAAGAQADGSSRNDKGSSGEKEIYNLILNRLQDRDLLPSDGIKRKGKELHLIDGRIVSFASDPDVAIRTQDLVTVAIEVKAGIDRAGTGERFGATLKSLGRIRQANPEAITILIFPDVSITERVRKDLSLSVETVTHFFGTSSIQDNENEREQFFALLNI